jgi:hypothetical protein
MPMRGSGHSSLLANVRFAAANPGRSGELSFWTRIAYRMGRREAGSIILGGRQDPLLCTEVLY